jgi:DNA-binding transcriptional MocR family regulator
VLVILRSDRYNSVVLEELLYEKVASHVNGMIDRGALRPGDRLPSVRKLSRQQHVSVSTVVQAYQALEDRGLIEARPQSGHYVRLRRLSALPEPRTARPSAIASKVSISDLVARVYGAVSDPRVMPFGAVVPHASLLPTVKLNRMLSQIAREAGGLAVAYDPPPGYPRLRSALARRSVVWGCPLSADDFVTTVGCMEALALCLMAVTKPGDAIAVEAPAYYGLLQLVEHLGLKVFEIPAHPRSGMELSILEALLAERKLAACLAMPNFNNPLGSLMSDESKEKLVGILAAHDVPLIEDDIYGELYFGDERPRPAKAFDQRGLVLLCGSVSKTLAPGYRVGWAAPGRYRERVERLKFAHSVATPVLTQMAIAEFLESGGYEHHLRQLRRRLAQEVARYTDTISLSFPAGTRISRPAGGFVLWIELPPGISALELHARALAEKISIAPGPIFSAKQRFTNCLRISCARPFDPDVERALERLGALAEVG